jgi:YVTN family beta-propeller protein
MKARIWKLVSLILITIFALSAVSMVHAIPTLAISSKITGLLTSSTAYNGYGTSTMTYDSGQHEIFITGFGYYGNNVSAVSDSTNEVVASVSIPDVGGLRGIAYDSGMNEIFVASGYQTAAGETPTVTVISDSNLALVANITQRNWWSPWAVAYDSGKNEIFVTDAGPNNGHQPGGVYIISDSNNTVSGGVYGGILVGIFPKAIAYDSIMGEIFVANQGSSTVSVIADSNNTVVATINVGGYPSSIAYDPNKGLMFVADSYDNTVSVISDSTNTVIATVTGLSGVAGIAYDSAKGEIFAGNAVISDSNNFPVVAYVPESFGSIVYDSGKGEIFGAGPTAIDVISDSAVPEFNSVALVLLLFLTVSVVVVLASKKSIRSHPHSMLTTK